MRPEDPRIVDQPTPAPAERAEAWLRAHGIRRGLVYSAAQVAVVAGAVLLLIYVIPR